MLKEIGVNYAQGYGIGKPQPFDKLFDWASHAIDITSQWVLNQQF
jgi:EAL domain-containing protein (putative c-di-GMP-specific phosphodiesterase class I)